MKINIKKKLKSAGSTIKGMGSIDKKSLKNGSYSMGITAIVIAVLVVINLIVGQIPEKYKNLEYFGGIGSQVGRCKYPEAVYDL